MSADSFIGRTIGQKYHVLARLGAGGMGAVYRARHAATGGDVAVKVLHGAAAFDEAMIKRFQLEAQNAAALRHANTIRVTDFGVDDGLFYLVMEYLEGRSLAELLRAEGRQPWRRAAHLLRQVLKSLWEAHEHERRIVHRDIKPGNIFLVDLPGEPDHIKVLDFGIARSLAGTGAGTQGVIGTPFYMAPEIWRGELVDARTDLYAVGCVAYELLAGAPPFTPPPSAVDSLLPLLGMHCHEPPPPLSGAAPDVPPPLVAWVEALLAKDRAARPASARAALDALDRAVAAADRAAMTPSPSPRDARPSATLLDPGPPGAPAPTPLPATGGPTPPPAPHSGDTLTRAGDLRLPVSSRGPRARRWLVAASAVVVASGVALGFALTRPAAPEPEIAGLAYLPSSTAAVVVLPAPRRLLDALDAEGLAARLGAELDPIAAETRRQTGLDLLAPATYEAQGLALDRPWGVALVDPLHGAVAVFASMADRARVEAALGRLATRGGFELTREELGEATVLAAPDGDQLVFVLRGELLVAVRVADLQGARRVAREIATLAPERSLLGAGRALAAMRELTAHEDLVGWVDLPRLGLDLQGSPTCEGADCVLERALSDATLGVLEGVAFGATVTERAVEVSAFAALPHDATLMRALRPFDGPPALLAATTERPMFLLTARLAPEEAQTFVPLLATGYGLRPEELRATARERGVDLDREVLAALTGELGVALVHDPDPSMRGGGRGLQESGLAIVAGVTRPEGVTRLLAALASADPTGILREARGRDGYALTFSRGPTLAVRAEGGFVSAATDGALATRLAARDPGAGFVSRLEDPALRGLLEREDAAVVALAPLQELTLRLIWDYVDCAWREGELPDDDGSPNEKRAELMALRAEVERSAVEEQGRVERARRRLSEAGGAALVLRVRPTGLALSGGQFTGRPVPRVIADLVADIIAGVRWRAEQRARCDRIQALEAELEGARTPTPEP